MELVAGDSIIGILIIFMAKVNGHHLGKRVSKTSSTLFHQVRLWSSGSLLRVKKEKRTH